MQSHSITLAAVSEELRSQHLEPAINTEMIKMIIMIIMIIILIIKKIIIK